MAVFRRAKTLAVIGIVLLGANWSTPTLRCKSPVAASSENNEESRSSRAAGVPGGVKRRAASALANLPLRFEENRGRAANGSSFIARAAGLDFSIYPTEAVMHLRAGQQSAKTLRHEMPRRIAGVRGSQPAPALPARRQTASLRMQLVGANRRARVVGENQLQSRTNYFIGNDPQRWRRNLANYARVKVQQVYRGVDMVYYGAGGQLEYDFNVAPGATYNSIRLRFNGARRLRIDEAGELVIDTPAGEIRQRRPAAYQLINGVRRVVAVGYILRGKREVRFIIGHYDKRSTLIIDPVLSYSTFFGGDGEDVINSVALDAQGNVYVAGSTDSIDFPITPGALPLPGNIDSSLVGFVAKIDLTNSSIIYSTYLGGSKSLIGNFALTDCRAISVDLAGNAYVTGKTNATNFPTSAGAFQSALAGADEAFVAKLNATGTGLIYSTYLGSSKSSDDPFPFIDFKALDEGTSIAVDPAGSAYVAGRTTGSNFPVTPGALKTIHNNDVFALVGDVDPPIRAFADAFITKLNPTGTALLYSTYLGGKGEDSCTGIAVDAAGMATLIGTTEARDFPTFNALQANLNGSLDAFVTRLSSDGSALVYSTYIGGSGTDLGNALALDELGNAYMTGTTTSTDLPVTAGAFQPSSADVNLFKSTNGGASWAPSNFGIPSDSSISQIVVDPADSAVLYASAANLVFNSTDGGRTWKNISNQLDPFSRPSTVLAIDPKKPLTVYGVRRSFFQTSLLKSLDGGRTWQVFNSFFPSAPPVNDILSVTIDPVNPSTLYAFTNFGLFRTTDGLSWVKRDRGLFDEAGFLGFLAIDPTNSNRLLASAGAKLFMSTNSGKQWNATSLGDLFVLSATFDPRTPSTAYATGAGLFKTTDSGATWQEIENDLPDIGTVVIDPTNSSVLYTATGAGIFKSTDAGHHWASINNGLRTDPELLISLVPFLAIDPRNPTTLYAAGFGNGPEVFVAKLNPSGSSFGYFTYLGGNGGDIASGIAVNTTGNVYVTGQTGSEDFPVRKAFQPDKFSIYNDVFVSKLNADGASLAYSTYIGGASLDVTSDIAVDGFGNAFIGGRTFSVDFPLVNALLSSFRTTDAQAFLSRIADADSALPAPAILSVSPQAGASTGQYIMTISGANFMPGARVRLGGVPVTLIDVTSTRITAVVNTRPAGVVNVVVSNPDGQSAVLKGGFTFLLVPEIEFVQIDGKLLEVVGRNFDKGAVILLEGSQQKTQQALFAPQRQSVVRSKKAAKKIPRGQQVTVQVRNFNGLISAPFIYFRPAD